MVNEAVSTRRNNEMFRADLVENGLAIIRMESLESRILQELVGQIISKAMGNPSICYHLEEKNFEDAIRHGNDTYEQAT